jgi:hypothetical protein
VIYYFVPVNLFTKLSSFYLPLTSIDRHDIKIKIKELTNHSGSHPKRVTKYVIATPASQQGVPPSIHIEGGTGHFQQASASDANSEGIGDANDNDGRTALAASSLQQGLPINSATDRGLRRNGHDATGTGTAPPSLPATDNGAVVTATVSSSPI